MEQQLQQIDTTIQKELNPKEDFTPTQREIVEMILWLTAITLDYAPKFDHRNKEIILLHKFIKYLVIEYFYLDSNIKIRWNKQIDDKGLDSSLKFQDVKITNKKLFKEDIVHFYKRIVYLKKKFKDNRFDVVIDFLKRRYMKSTLAYDAKYNIPDIAAP